MIWISTKLYITHMEGINAYVNKYAYRYTYSYICICDSPIFVKFGNLLWFEKSDVLRGLLRIQQQRLCFTAEVRLAVEL
jgi:hypothetical protein